MYGLNPAEWELLDTLAIQRLKEITAQVWNLGSWSRGDQKKFSDIDLLYSVTQPLQNGLIFDVTSNLEESNLPLR